MAKSPRSGDKPFGRMEREPSRKPMSAVQPMKKHQPANSSAAPAAPRYVRSISEAATHLGVSERHARRLLASDDAPRPDAKGRYRTADLAECRRRLEDRRRVQQSDPELLALKKERLKISNARQQLLLERERGALLPAEAVRQTWVGGVARLVGLLRTALECELPPILAGRSAVDVLHELQRVVDRTIRTMAGVLPDGGAPAPPPPAPPPPPSAPLTRKPKPKHT